MWLGLWFFPFFLYSLLAIWSDVVQCFSKYSPFKNKKDYYQLHVYPDVVLRKDSSVQLKYPFKINIQSKLPLYNENFKNGSQYVYKLNKETKSQLSLCCQIERRSFFTSSSIYSHYALNLILSFYSSPLFPGTRRHWPQLNHLLNHKKELENTSLLYDDLATDSYSSFSIITRTYPPGVIIT